MRDPRSDLAATLKRLTLLTGESGPGGDALDVAALSYATGVPEPTVRALLAGEHVPEEDFAERVRRRIVFLRGTRPRPDGRPYSFKAIAESFGASGAALSALVNGKGAPLASTAAGIERFFGVPNGFLTAEATQALDAALQPVLTRLEREADPLSEVKERYAVRGAALRAAKELSEDKWKVLAATLGALLAQDEEGAGGAGGEDPAGGARNGAPRGDGRPGVG
ncbi:MULTISPECIES: XRE family transcriptional regulator [Streptomyces]|uniref:XRE family transcriptional regulator n=1 Tax=Streptomyces TaxID=1883 RepID=UPI0022494CAD|nr:XRE family transcriptional regulator [Streptomyces sp. JHD 1]MCX2969221.1 XRE family transcriptional regulator [Streptomyces sp. JHD 1]